MLDKPQYIVYVVYMIKTTNSSTNSREAKMTNDQKQQLERDHNVVIDIDTMQYNTNDTEYGWQPIPTEWVAL